MIALDDTATKRLSKRAQVKSQHNNDKDPSILNELENKNKKRTKLRRMHLENESEDDGDHKSATGGNPGWADVMQRILHTKKPKRKKSIVLSKAKKLVDVKKKVEEESLPFEIEKAEEEVKTEDEQEETKDDVEKLPAQLKQRRNEKSLGIRVKPSITDRERERTLQKIATRGVVQLFNAVKEQQGEINKKLKEAGPLERKREQVLKSIDKSSFLDVLMGGSKSISVDNAVKDEQENRNSENKKDKGIWNVLREDFVMGTKLKDWDRKDQDEDDSSAPEEMDSDD
ncbi:RRP15-like protein [Ceratina calcarata]|uniref:RRP15-like protein n=1 Tax=Ceratina calcarata TaxID=156304 RepID=A0AAJ7J274_9HYME|nr:RRP15-like protein [Ceratina calcarata]